MMVVLGGVFVGLATEMGDTGWRKFMNVLAGCLIIPGLLGIAYGGGGGDGDWFLWYSPEVPGTPATPGLAGVASTHYNEGIQPLHCHQFSDCKYHDNCLWDEITSIIDGPQDYHNSYFYDKDTDIEMTEMMYGFIYLLHKYKDKTAEDKVYFRELRQNDPVTTDSTIPSTYSDLFNDGRYLKPDATVGSAANTTRNNSPGNIVYTDIDGNKNLKKWTASLINDSNKNSLVMKDNSGNTTKISDLAEEYGTEPQAIEKVFWYYWSIFHDGTTGNLRPEVFYLLDPGNIYQIKQRTDAASFSVPTKTFYDNLVFGAASISGRNILGMESNKFKEEVRKCIPIIRLILKDWLNKNLVVGLSAEMNSLPGCEVVNKVCTYGVDEKTGECKESCYNDEILDYSKGLCYNNDTGIDTHYETANSSTNFYQKSGCINNNLINNDAVRGEQCGDYYDRAEASGFNVDCNHEESIVHYDTFQQKPSAADLYCSKQFSGSNDDDAAAATADVKKTICGDGLSGVNYSWDRNETIDTGISKFSSYHVRDSKNQGEYSDVSPILSCCKKNSDQECLNGYWISDTSSNTKGYCSNNQAETFDINEVASKLNKTKLEVCNIFGNKVSGCPGADGDEGDDENE
jgi:hypothetical protein